MVPDDKYMGALKQLLIRKYTYWMLACLGCLLCLALIFLQSLPEKIRKGENAHAAIAMLDAMRRPLLEIKAAENQLFLENNLSQALPKFNEAIRKSQDYLDNYEKIGRYNPVVAVNIMELRTVIDDWLVRQRRLFDSYEEPHTHREMAQVTQGLLVSLNTLGNAEDPIHNDIAIGRSAYNEMLSIAFVLFVYLVGLIILQQLTRTRFLNSAKQAVERANKIQSRFIANTSHEFRTPMNGILGSLQLLSSTHLRPQQRDYLEIAKSSSQTLLGLINDLLDISVIESGVIQIVCEHYDIRDTVEQVLDVQKELTQGKDLELLAQFDEALPSQVYGDPLRFQKVLNQLMSNAIKFTLQGKITVKVSKLDNDGIEMMCTEVTDPGIGIPKEKQKEVFTHFTQVDSSNTRQYGGNGLGLAIAKQLVEQMGGEIGLRSQPGSGSVFYFSLPTYIDEDIRAIDQKAV